MNPAKLSVVIAAKNEAPRIGAVLEVVTKHPDIDQVIVMVDKSEDNTLEVAKNYNAEVHENKEGCSGKTMAVKNGLEFVRNDIVLLIDADLKGLTEENIRNLAKPVLEGKADFTLSLRGNSAFIYKMAGIDFVSGERAAKKEMLLEPEIWAKPKVCYGLEVLMNKTFLKKNKKFVSVSLPNLLITKKSEKTSYIKGTIDEFLMIFNIFKALPFYEVGWQFFTMARLNRKYKKELGKAE